MQGLKQVFLSGLFVVVVTVVVTLSACGGGGSSGGGSSISAPPADFYVANGIVYASALSTDGRTLYIGGEFTQVGPNTGSFVPIDAVSAEPVAGFPRVDGQVLASAADGKGGGYIGGDFTVVGDRARNNLAHILTDGNVDPNWDPDPNNIVNTLAVSGDTVYLGGLFSSVGGQRRDHLVDAGSGALTDWNPDANGWVNTLVVVGKTVYVGGRFTSIGGQDRNYIAALDATLDTNNATAWDPNADNTVYTLVVSSNTVYVGGSAAMVKKHFALKALGRVLSCIWALTASVIAPSAWSAVEWKPELVAVEGVRTPSDPIRLIVSGLAPATFQNLTFDLDDIDVTAFVARQGRFAIFTPPPLEFGKHLSLNRIAWTDDTQRSASAVDWQKASSFAQHANAGGSGAAYPRSTAFIALTRPTPGQDE